MGKKKKNTNSNVTVQPKQEAVQEPIITTIPEAITKTVETAKENCVAPSMVGNGVTCDTLTRLGTLMQDRYVNGNNMGKKYPAQFIDFMNNQVDVCVIGAIILANEEAVSKGGKLQLLFPEEKLPEVISAAASIGIILPEVKVLENKEDNGVKQLKLDFSKAEVPLNIVEEAKKEVAAKAISLPIEMDPKKIKDEDELHKAANSILTNSLGGQFAKRVASAIDLLKQYRIVQCNGNLDKIEAVENKTIDSWLKELVDTVDNGVVLKCLASGMYTSLVATHCPIGAFLLLRKNLLTDNGTPTKTPIWTEQSIALAVSTLIEMAAKNRIADMVDADGKPKEGAIVDIKDDKNLDYVHFFNESVISDIMDEKKRAIDAGLKNIYGLALANYYDAVTSKMADVNVQENIRHKIGVIANLFHPFDSKFKEFDVEQPTKNASKASKKTEGVIIPENTSKEETKKKQN